MSLAGLSEHVSRIVGAAGRAAVVTTRSMTVKPGNLDQVPFVIDMTGSEFTADIFRVIAGNLSAAMLMNNNGVLFVYRGLSVLDNDDTQPKLKIEQADGSINLGSGTAAVDWSLTRTAADTASLGANDNLIIPGTLTIGGLAGGYASICKLGTD